MDAAEEIAALPEDEARILLAAALATGTPVVKVFDTAVAPKQYAR